MLVPEADRSAAPCYTLGITGGSTMASVKTAVSLDESLFRRIDDLARKKRMSRSRLHAIALEELLRREEIHELTESYNAAYSDGLEAEERVALRDAEPMYWETLEDE